METAVFGGGCFWCTEAVFAAIEGVQSVEPGYCGGNSTNPTYEEVCGGQSGHIEVVKIVFEPSVVSFETLLDVFFATHDPTTPNRQGNDVGPQYQSAIFCQGSAQKQKAERVIAELGVQGVFPAPICTLLLDEVSFWPAEAYHREYFDRHPGQGYCQFVIAPKLQKFRARYVGLLKLNDH